MARIPNFSPHLSALVTCAFLSAPIYGVNAASIVVPNFSFESLVYGDGGYDFVVPSWIGTSSGSGSNYGIYNPLDDDFAGSSGGGSVPSPAIGEQAAFMHLDPSGTVSLTTATAFTSILADTSYTLTVALGSRNLLPGSSTGMVTLSLLANGVLIPGASITITPDSVTIPLGTFADFSTSFTTDSSTLLIGQDLTASVTYSATTVSQVLLDNVRVDAFTVPEPSTTLVGVISVLGLVVRRIRNDRTG